MTNLEIAELRLADMKRNNPDSPEIKRYEDIIIPDLKKQK